uniref:SHC adaptor protein 3 n=1 Tax=Equus asinus TaxID=9793 RepID=A0A8C4M4W6_EQUAS
MEYLGCIEVLRSMRSLDFSTRTQITREAISRVCEAVPGTKGAFRKRKPPSKVLSSILGKSNLQFAGMSISLTISTASLNLRTPDSKQIIANHHMQSISFASGGDPDTTDYVAYVAKDPVNRRAQAAFLRTYVNIESQIRVATGVVWRGGHTTSLTSLQSLPKRLLFFLLRAAAFGDDTFLLLGTCHILECCDGLAQDVIGSIGQAFELRFKQYLQCPSKMPALHDRMQSLDEPWTEEEGDGSDHPYYNSIPSKTAPPGGFGDARLKARPHAPDTAQFSGKEQTYYQGRHLGGPTAEDWRQTAVRQGSLDVYSTPEGKGPAAPMGEAPAYVNAPPGPTPDSSAESSPRKDLFDMKPFEDALKNQPMGPVLSKAASVECISPVSPRAPDAKMLEELKAEPWYQGEMSRKEAEGLLKRDGDFLVRKSTTNPGSFVLTGMHDGHAKHLLLVDPEGTRTDAA